jgi:hypothetical protein
MTDRDLMQQALEALIWTTGSDDFGDGGKAREGALKLLFPSITALRERLAQPVQELVCVCGAIWEGQELVSAPSQRQWQGLTAYEIQEIHSGNQYWGDFACAIEAKLREKNHG